MMSSRRCLFLPQAGLDGKQKYCRRKTMIELNFFSSGRAIFFFRYTFSFTQSCYRAMGAIRLIESMIMSKKKITIWLKKKTFRTQNSTLPVGEETFLLSGGVHKLFRLKLFKYKRQQVQVTKFLKLSNVKIQTNLQTHAWLCIKWTFPKS